MLGHHLTVPRGPGGRKTRSKAKPNTDLEEITDLKKKKKKIMGIMRVVMIIRRERVVGNAVGTT